MTNDITSSNNRPLKAMAKNEHFWRCLPIHYVRHMMRTTNIGRKLDIKTAFEGAKVMSRVHNVDLKVS